MEVIGKALQRNPLVMEDKERIDAQITERQMKLREFKCQTSMSYDEFKELLSAYATELMLQRSVTRSFMIDHANEPIIRQLYLYFTGSRECAWNQNAGLIFAGKIGSGKTVLMTAFLKITDDYSRRRTTVAHAKQLPSLFRKNTIEFYEKRPLFVDDLGKEETEIKDFGTIIRPWIDLFSLRYDQGARTYATTNFNMQDLQKIYGEFICSRMAEQMTLVFIPGESRRLKNDVKTK